jgi:hypothetical protein
VRFREGNSVWGVDQDLTGLTLNIFPNSNSDFEGNKESVITSYKKESVITYIIAAL